MKKPGSYYSKVQHKTPKPITVIRRLGLLDTLISFPSLPDKSSINPENAIRALRLFSKGRISLSGSSKIYKRLYAQGGLHAFSIQEFKSVLRLCA